MKNKLFEYEKTFLSSFFFLHFYITFAAEKIHLI